MDFADWASTLSRQGNRDVPVVESRAGLVSREFDLFLTFREPSLCFINYDSERAGCISNERQKRPADRAVWPGYQVPRGSESGSTLLTDNCQ